MCLEPDSLSFGTKPENVDDPFDTKPEFETVEHDEKSCIEHGVEQHCVEQQVEHCVERAVFVNVADQLQKTITAFAGVRVDGREAIVDTAAEEAVIGSGAFSRLRTSLERFGLRPASASGATVSCSGIGGSAKIAGVWDIPIGVARTNGLIRATEVEDNGSFETPSSGVRPMRERARTPTSPGGPGAVRNPLQRRRSSGVDLMGQQHDTDPVEPRRVTFEELNESTSAAAPPKGMKTINSQAKPRKSAKAAMLSVMVIASAFSGTQSFLSSLGTVAVS